MDPQKIVDVAKSAEEKGQISLSKLYFAYQAAQREAVAVGSDYIRSPEFSLYKALQESVPKSVNRATVLLDALKDPESKFVRILSAEFADNLRATAFGVVAVIANSFVDREKERITKATRDDCFNASVDTEVSVMLFPSPRENMRVQFRTETNPNALDQMKIKLSGRQKIIDTLVPDSNVTKPTKLDPELAYQLFHLIGLHKDVQPPSYRHRPKVDCVGDDRDFGSVFNKIMASFLEDGLSFTAQPAKYKPRNWPERLLWAFGDSKAVELSITINQAKSARDRRIDTDLFWKLAYMVLSSPFNQNYTILD